MTITIIKPGLFTSIQDLGRWGYQQYGVIVGGAMDRLSYRIGEMILDQTPSAALEFTLIGPTVKFNCDAVFCLTGANFHPLLNEMPCPMWKPVFAEKGSILKLSYCQKGARGYLHIKGGIRVEKVLDSFSTYSRARIGGFKGRPLAKEDELPILPSSPFSIGKWGIQPRNWLFWKEPVVIRIVESTEYDFFTDESKDSLVTSVFTITKEADRMGYRLEGEHPLLTKEPINLLSEAVTFGTIQIPPNGHPIILMADCQTTGGYPKIAQVVSVDLPKLAQLKPYEKICFQLVSLEEAQQLLVQQEKAFKLLELLCSKNDEENFKN
ncbi:biotin-dependent carboxyltransferase family protein [Ureibacillus thermophilus]|uniref:5-oxoprolinase subunit C family protein n=1 Tax=Ureibacillus thermophilus TaxID=367743 RepID=UPI00360F550F